MANTDTGVFDTVDQEETFLKTFKALLDEWGKENIVVAVPTSWESMLNRPSDFKLEYSTFQSLIILVTPPGDSRPAIAYEVLLENA